MLGSEPVAVQADHFTICKPESESAPVFKSVCALVRKLLDNQTSPAGSEPTGTDQKPVQDGVEPSDDKVHAPVFDSVSSDILNDFEYFTTVAEDDRRDIEQKLIDADRSYAIRDAKRKKERFNMALQRNIAQPAAVTRYTRLMSEVESRFNRHVTRAIADGACQATIDGIIQNDVISPCLALDASQNDPLTAGLVDGAMYYLAGNCHLAWDNG